jgi:hypothetical protein
MDLSTLSGTPGARKAPYWIGWGLSGLVIAFMIMDFTMKLLALPVVLQASGALGYVGADMARELGAIALVSTALYAYPRTAMLGAVLLTAIMGGAVASHLRVGSPLATHVLFGAYLGAMLWAGLWLREPRLRALMPLR